MLSLAHKKNDSSFHSQEENYFHIKYVAFPIVIYLSFLSVDMDGKATEMEK